MIETVLFFTLGFLSAAFLALMIAPAVRRRAVALTRRRIEASVPLTLEEIKADKDRMRAEFAMSTRRLEMTIKQMREKAARQVVEINRVHEERKALAEERDDKARVIGELEAALAELREELAGRERELEHESGAHAATRSELDRTAAALEETEGLYEEASLLASGRQIELVGREADIEKLNGEIGAARNRQKETEGRLRETERENTSLQTALREEQRRAEELSRRLEHGLTRTSDMEEKLERREKELARLREQLKQSEAGRVEADRQLADARHAGARLEKQVARLEARHSGAGREATGDLALPPIAEAQAGDEAEAARLHRENEALREEIAQLAAEFVAMAAVLEGRDSPLEAILAADALRVAPGDAERPVSLAERVRLLQRAAASRAGS